MENPSLQIGDNNWAVKDGSILGYNIIQDNYLPHPIDFTRASSATRVNAEGLIEGVRTNTFLYSEDFSNATWLKERISVSSNVTTAPDGTSTADKLVENTDNNSHRARQNANSTQNVEYTLSYYLKASERTKARVFAAGLNANAYFDLSTGSIIGAPTLCAASIVSAGNGWYRCAITYTQTSATSAAQIHWVAILNAAGDFVYTGDGTSGIFIWGAQLEIGVLTDYIPTTTTAVSVGMLANVPRIDYTGGGFGKLLLEPQRTNIALRSEEFSNASSWVLANSGTITANTTISPDGTQTADTLNAGANSAQVQQHRTDTSGAVYTVSIWVKRITGTGNVFLRAVVNADTLIAVTSDWQRFTATVTSTTTTIRIGVKLATSGDAVAIWGGQVELGSYATSYIPTTTTAVTRTQDNASKTGISSLIGQTEGTIFAEFDSPQFLSGSYIGISDGTTSNRQIFGFEGASGNSGALRLYGFWTFIYGTFASGEKIKVALAYKNNDFALYVNGTQAGTNSGATISGTLSQFGFNSGASAQIYQGNVYQTELYKERLTNAELATLTTL